MVSISSGVYQVCRKWLDHSVFEFSDTAGVSLKIWDLRFPWRRTDRSQIDSL
jgi:hypothetical protein